MLNRKLICLCAVLILGTASTVAAQQKPTSLTANAKGTGTIKIGNEQFPLYTVVVKLNEGGALELTLVSEITVFFTGTWSAPDDMTKGIDLTITGSEDSSTMRGAGKLFLKADGTSIASMKLQAENKLRKKLIDVTFVAQ
jgi:hypothetical protein